jgi:hypothetical protein
MTGALTADREVIVPDVDKVYIFKNGTSGGFALTFKTSGGTGVTIPNGRAAICYVDSGTGTVNAIDDGYFTDSIYIEGSSAGDFITAESTNAGATSGPDIKLYRNSASPADSDVLSKITFTANTDNGAGGVSVSDVEYASINVSAPETNETSGEAGKMVIALKRGGTTQNYIEIQGGTSADADNDSIVFKTGGSAVLTIDNNQDMLVDTDSKLQFRDSAIYIQSGSDGNLNIEADTAIAFDTDTLYVDTANNRVGIGVAAPNTQLELSSNNGAGTALNILRFNDSDTAQSANQPLGKVEFFVNDASSGGTGVGAFIQGLAQGTSGGGQITFGGSNSTATGATEGMRIDGSNRVLIGATSSIEVEGYYRPKFQVADALDGDSAGRGILINYGRNNTGSGPAVMYSRHSGTTVGSEGNVLNNYVLGENRYTGWYSDNYYLGARIAAEVDGTPSSADMPTRLVFATTADGASTATERMRISQNGDVGIGEGVSINARLHVKDTIESTGGASSAAPIFIIQNERVNTGSSSAVMRFDTNEISGTNQYARATIAGEYDGSSNVAGRLMFSTNNTSDNLVEAMRLDSSQRVLIAQTTARNSFFGNNVGTYNPRLQVEANNTSSGARMASFVLNDDSNNAFIQIFGRSRGTTANSLTAVAEDDNIGVISWQGATGNTLTEAAQIKAEVDGAVGSADMPGRLVFRTTGDGNSSSSERMRITNAGHVLVGQTSTNTPGVGNTTNGHSLRSDGLFFSSAYQNRTGTFGRNGNDGAVLGIYKDGVNAGDLGVKVANSAARLYLGNSNTKLLFDNGGDRIYPVNNDGNARNAAIDLGLYGAAFKDLYLTGGIQFDNRSNKLDDYEEGTWTDPTITFGGGSTGLTYLQRDGWYTKIGRLVTVGWEIVLSNKGTSTGNLALSNLPFTIASTQRQVSGVFYFQFMASGFPAGAKSFYGNAGTTSGAGVAYFDGTSGTSSSLNDTHFGNSSYWYGIYTYYVN